MKHLEQLLLSTGTTQITINLNYFYVLYETSFKMKLATKI